MIISYCNKFIFIKTRKTAGSSLEVGLSRVCGPNDIITRLSSKLGEEKMRREEGGIGPLNCMKSIAEHRGFREWRKLLLRGKRAERYSQHMTAQEIRDRIGEPIWSSCLRFTIERNPWDRALSRYWWRKYKWEKRGRSNFPDLTEFLLYLEREKPHRLTNWGHYTINDQIAVDRVIFYETLSRDLEQLHRDLGLEGDISLPRERAKGSFRQDKRHHSEILSPKDKEIIARNCRREIEAFGYEFKPQSTQGRE